MPPVWTSITTAAALLSAHSRSCVYCCSPISMVIVTSRPGSASSRDSSRMTRPTELTSSWLVPATPRRLASWNLPRCRPCRCGSPAASAPDRRSVPTPKRRRHSPAGWAVAVSHRGSSASRRRRCDTPGRSGALTSIMVTSSQVRFSLTVTGTKARLRWISGDAALIGVGQRHDLRDQLQHAVDLARLLAHHHDAEILLVDRQRHAEPVQDLPARRRQQPHIDAVFLRQHGVAVGFEDLQIVHAADQGEEHEPPVRRPASRPGG